MDPRSPRADLLSEFGRVFDEMNAAADQWASDDQIFGILGFGYATAWEFPKDGLPRLHIVAPMRWNLVSDRQGEMDLFRDVLEGWSGRFRRRMQAIVDGQIEE